MSASAPEWWLACIGDTLVWARMTVLDSGNTEILDSKGETSRYDDETEARMALLDAQYRAFDGLDEDDAAMLGFDLEETEPPRAGDDKELLSRMIEKLPPQH